MIAYIKGKIAKKTDKGAILITGDIGYFVHLSKQILSSLSAETEQEFFIHTNVREDALDLYGFTSFDELQFFKTLITINGIGPKVALEILNFPAERIKAAIFAEDTDFITSIPGIGKKTAQRIILELKGKIEHIDSPDSLPNIHQDAIEALEKLGYQRKHITGTLKKMPSKLKEAEEIITYFLKNN